MKIKGWKYYNHAAIPTTAPHEEVNLEVIKDKTIWKMDGKPLFARWISNWDCQEQTNWWYIICDAPYTFDNLSKKTKKNIRRALDKCEVKRIEPIEYACDLWRVFQEAASRYSNYEMIEREDFMAMLNSIKPNAEYWGGFDRETNRLIGYKVCTVFEDWVDFTVSKYSTDFLRLRVSDALNNVVLEYYLNEQGKKYVSNGSRSVLHETNVQEYYQEHFNFRKAFCRLNITYRKGFGLIVKTFFPFRKIIKNSSGIGNKI